MERGTVEWNSGIVERWNAGMEINDPVPFLSGPIGHAHYSN